MGLVVLGLLRDVLTDFVATDGSNGFLFVLDTREEQFVGLGEADLGEVHVDFDAVFSGALLAIIIYYGLLLFGNYYHLILSFFIIIVYNFKK